MNAGSSEPERRRRNGDRKGVWRRRTMRWKRSGVAGVHILLLVIIAEIGYTEVY